MPPDATVLALLFFACCDCGWEKMERERGRTGPKKLKEREEERGIESEKKDSQPLTNHSVCPPRPPAPAGHVSRACPSPGWRRACP